MLFLIPQNLDDFLLNECNEAHHIEPLKLQLSRVYAGEIPLKMKHDGQRTFYSADANVGRHYHRFIFEPILLNRTQAYVLRSLVWSHKYRKALGYQPIGDLAVIPEDYELISTTENQDITIDMGRTVEIRDNLYELTKTQSDVLEGATFPQLVVGPPGCGKTLLAMAFFQEQALKHVSNASEPLKLCYITPTKALSDSFQNDFNAWAALNLEDHLELVKLTVLTVESLWLSAGSEEDVQNKQIALGEDYLQELIHPMTERDRRLNAKQFLSEMLLCAHILNSDDGKSYNNSRYKELGVNESIISNDQERAIFYPLAQTVLSKLRQEERRVIGIFGPQKIDSHYQHDYTVFDEGQNASVATLEPV